MLFVYIFNQIVKYKFISPGNGKRTHPRIGWKISKMERKHDHDSIQFII